jgi:hypothetical protein
MGFLKIIGQKRGKERSFAPLQGKSTRMHEHTNTGIHVLKRWNFRFR